MFSKKLIICFLAIALLGNLRLFAVERAISADDLYDKARGMWLSQLIANYAGRSTEGRFKSSTPNPAESVPWVLKQVWDADDDTDIEYIAMHILETNGFDCTGAELSSQWLEHITTSGIYISNRQALFLMDDGHTPPETGSRQYNMHWYSIDSQITTEVIGAICPAMPQQAIDLTGKFARISNEGFPTHAAQLYSAMYANAFFESSLDPNVVEIVTDGLKAIPQSSRTYEIAADVLRWYIEDAKDGDMDWRDTRKKIYDNYQGTLSNGRYYNWIESTVNTGATILAILYGGGDFKQTCQIGVLAGWDCDCNPATAAGLIGIIKGYSGMPADLTDPSVCGDSYKNIYRPLLPDENLPLPQYDTISNIAARIAALAEQNIINNGGYITGTGASKILHIIESPLPLLTDAEKPNPTGPGGLVGEALSAGLTVTATAAVEYYNQNSDRYNLNAIINGITDNSHNGHKPYSSYTSSSNKPEKDWYQLNFSQPVKFDSLTFYEGDIVWDGINTYYKDSPSKGGFFEDITVQVLKDGIYVTPANLQLSEPLDQYKMYQQIDFTFSPVISDTIRIIGTAGGSMQYTTIMELQAGGTTETGLLFGDTDGSGKIDLIDFAVLSALWNENAQTSGLDFDGDGMVKLPDLAAFCNNWLSFWPN